MQRFTDREGSRWDVVAGRESWGALVALFVPAAGSGAGARQTALSSASYEAAQQELDELDTTALQALLDRSSLKEG